MQLKRYCRTCGGHIYRHNYTTSPPKFRWVCAKSCTYSVSSYSAAFPTEFVKGGPREQDPPATKE